MWTDYIGPNQLSAGEYLWRVPHVWLDGVVLVFKSKVRMRGHGYGADVSSPQFDHWNGYRIIMPADTQFRDIKDDDPSLDVEGVELLECPFCGGVAGWESEGGYIGAGPHHDTSFTIKHCIAAVHRERPSKAAAVWNGRALAKGVG